MGYANNKNTMQVTRSLAMSEELSGDMICIKGQAIGSRISLQSDRTILIGRDPSVCNYVIRDLKISRKHLKITYVGALNSYRVVDCSSNGTFLRGGFRLQNDQEYYLSPGEELQLGGSETIYKLR